MLNSKNIARATIIVLTATALAVAGCSTVMSTVDNASGSDESSSDQSDGEVPDHEKPEFQPDGFLSDVHEKHAGQVVFSTEKITRDNHTEVEFQDTFTLEDSIYMRSFFKNAIAYLFDETKECAYEERRNTRVDAMLQINDQPRSKWISQYEEPVYDKEQFLTWTTTSIIGDSFTSTADAEQDPIFREDNELLLTFAGNLLPRLEPGTHKITVHAMAECLTDPVEEENEIEIATGSFTLEIADQAAIDAFYADRAPTLPDAKHPKADWVEKKTLEKLTAKYGDDEYPEYEFISARATDDDWTVVRDDVTSQIKGRRTGGIVLMKHRETGDCVARIFETTQQYDGSKYMNADSNLKTNTPRPVRCVDS